MYKNTDTTFLLTLQTMLSQNPRTTQRDIAVELSISLGLTNQILTRVAQKGWIYIDRVNARNMQYTITPLGSAEIARVRSEQKRKSFAELRRYGASIAERICTAKADGYEKVVLYGQSDLDFLLAYECQKQAMPFEQRAAAELTNTIEADIYAVAGEQNSQTDADQTQPKAVSVLELAG